MTHNPNQKLIYQSLSIKRAVKYFSSNQNAHGTPQRISNISLNEIILQSCTSMTVRSAKICPSFFVLSKDSYGFVFRFLAPFFWNRSHLVSFLAFSLKSQAFCSQNVLLEMLGDPWNVENVILLFESYCLLLHLFFLDLLSKPSVDPSPPLPFFDKVSILGWQCRHVIMLMDRLNCQIWRESFYISFLIPW